MESVLMGAAGHRSIWSLGYGGGRQSETENENIERHEIPATNLIQEAREGVSLDEFRRPGSLDPL